MITTAKIMLTSNKLFFQNSSYYYHYNFEQNYYYCIQKFEHIFQISINKSTEIEIIILNTFLLKIPQSVSYFRSVKLWKPQRQPVTPRSYYSSRSPLRWRTRLSCTSSELKLELGPSSNVRPRSELGVLCMSGLRSRFVSGYAYSSGGGNWCP